MSQEALDERKELLGLIKGQERDINECEKNIGYFERRIRTVKSHWRYQSEDGTISMRQQRSIKKAEAEIQYWTSLANTHKKFKKYYMSLLDEVCSFFVNFHRHSEVNITTCFLNSDSH